MLLKVLTVVAITTSVFDYRGRCIRHPRIMMSKVNEVQLHGKRPSGGERVMHSGKRSETTLWKCKNIAC